MHSGGKRPKTKLAVSVNDRVRRLANKKNEEDTKWNAQEKRAARQDGKHGNFASLNQNNYHSFKHRLTFPSVTVRIHLNIYRSIIFIAETRQRDRHDKGERDERNFYLRCLSAVFSFVSFFPVSVPLSSLFMSPVLLPLCLFSFHSALAFSFSFYFLRLVFLWMSLAAVLLSSAVRNSSSRALSPI